MTKDEAARSIYLINMIERTAICKKRAERKGSIRKWSRFHNIQLQAKFELRKILNREEEQAQEVQEREKVAKLLQDMQRRGLIKEAQAVAKAHGIPLKEVTQK